MLFVPPDSLDLDDASEQSSSIANFAKKMSMSLSGDCLSSLREVIEQTRRASKEGLEHNSEDEGGWLENYFYRIRV